MIREELEFRIARYADGDLSAAERCAVEAELAADAEARAVLAEYRTLRTAIEEAAGQALPKVHWDRLEQLLSAAVARSDGPASGESEGPSQDGGPFAGDLTIEQEFAIACHADSTLLPQDRADVERLLAGDARARAKRAQRWPPCGGGELARRSCEPGHTARFDGGGRHARTAGAGARRLGPAPRRQPHARRMAPRQTRVRPASTNTTTSAR